MSTLKVDTILKRTGTGTITVGQSGDTISIPSGATLNSAGTNTLTGIDNTPSFGATASSTQSISNGGFVKVTLDTESWDTDSAFGSSKFTVPSGQDGKYHFTAGIHIQDHTSGRTQAAFYKNGSIVATNTGMGQFRNIHHEGDTTYMYMSWNGNLSATDYIELFCEQTGGSDENIMLGTWLSGFKLTGV